MCAFICWQEGYRDKMIERCKNWWGKVLKKVVRRKRSREPRNQSTSIRQGCGRPRPELALWVFILVCVCVQSGSRAHMCTYMWRSYTRLTWKPDMVTSVFYCSPVYLFRQGLSVRPTSLENPLPSPPSPFTFTWISDTYPCAPFLHEC